MNELFRTSVLFGVFISLLTYRIGLKLKQRWNFGLVNPLLISIILTIIFLKAFKVEYSIYNEGAKYISYFLTPATVCLAVPLYEQWELLRKNYIAITAGILSGVFVSATTILVLCRFLKFDHKTYVTLLPKSITTAIGIGISEELGGYVAITVAAIIITGVMGNVLAPLICRLFRITKPIAKGVGIGSASHAIGTSKALEMGELEGAISSLSLVATGLITVIVAPLIANFI